MMHRSTHKSGYVLALAIAAVLFCVGCEESRSSFGGVVGNATAAKSRIALPEVERYVAVTPDWVTGSVESLASYLNAASSDQTTKAYAIYRWIRDNIQADVERAQSGTIDPTTQTPLSVLHNRQAVCTGYARLFEELAELCGLDAAQIFGYGVMICRDPSESTSGYKHVWNGVKIDGAWYLLDVSWNASPVLDGSDDPNFFFLTPPQDFVDRHLPHDSEWQLLNSPVPEDVFWGLLAQCP